MILSTTFAELKKYDACESGYKKLTKHLGGITKYGRTTPIDLLTILENNGLDDCIWSLRAAVEPERDKIARLFATDCAEAVLPIFKSEKPDDPRPRKAIQAARDFAVGLISRPELAAAEAAAWAATEAAAWAVANAAAWAAANAAKAAAEAAAWAAAWAAADAWAAARAADAWAAAAAAGAADAWAADEDAAGDAAGDAQTENLRKYLTGEK